jgi:hypothetical protein
MSQGPPNPYLRAGDKDREQAVERLHRAVVEGRLDADELEERLEAAYAARWTSDLNALTADITPPPVYPLDLPPPIGYPMPPPPPKATNGMAVASLIAGLVWFGWLGSVCAVVFGHVALSQIRRSDGRETGREMAKAGLALGYLELLLLVLIVALH